MPNVIEPERPKGFPIAITDIPTFREEDEENSRGYKSERGA
jgi:hypothetical protein